MARLGGKLCEALVAHVCNCRGGPKDCMSILVQALEVIMQCSAAEQLLPLLQEQISYPISMVFDSAGGGSGKHASVCWGTGGRLHAMHAHCMGWTSPGHVTRHVRPWKLHHTLTCMPGHTRARTHAHTHTRARIKWPFDGVQAARAQERVGSTD